MLGVPKTLSLFNWTKWETFCNNSEKITKIQQSTVNQNSNENGLSTTPDFINNWKFRIKIMPEAVDHYFIYKSLSKNAVKSELEKEKKKIEDQYPKVPIYKTDANGKVIEPLEKVGERWPDNWPYVKLYIDTLEYNEWQEKIDQLNVLATQYSKLPEEIPVSDDEEPKKSNGEPYEPLCDKYFPMDMLGIFDILPDALFPSLFTVDELLFNPDGSPQIEYVEDENGQKTKKQKTKPHKVSIKDGYAYVSNGVIITMEYTGLPLSKTSTLIPGVGPEYGAVLGGYYKPSTNEDRENAMKFPYQNDDPNGKYWWLQTSKPNISDITNVINIRK